LGFRSTADWAAGNGAAAKASRTARLRQRRSIAIAFIGIA
jgi:hypothetical protein